MPAKPISTFSTVALYLGFALTGVAVAFPGAALPAILTHWSLKDGDAGLLFLLLSAGSSSGALLCRGRATHALAAGSAICAAASLLLIAAGRAELQAVFLLYGLGLGITMTAISLIRSERSGTLRGLEMNRLNLVWAAGAFACPALATHALRTASIAFLVEGLAGAFTALTLWAIFIEMQLLSMPRHATDKGQAATHALPLYLLIMTTLVTGVESAAGGWLATYANRMQVSVLGTVTVATAFWGGLLVSRGLSSMRGVHRISEMFRLQFGAVLAAVAATLMFFAQTQPVLAVAGFLLGFGLGPVYPLLLAFILPRFTGNRVFFIAGVGAAVLPWVTGSLSSMRGSLHAGLAAPLIAAYVLAVTSYCLRANRSA